MEDAVLLSREFHHGLLVITALLLAVALQSRAAETPHAEAQVSVPDAPEWAWTDFPVFVWRQRYAGKPLPENLIAPFGGTNVMRGESATWVREGGHAFYVSNAAGRNDLHLDADEAWLSRVERWSQARKESDLVRSPCLTDSATRTRLEETLAASLGARGGDYGFGLSLCDEVSMNPSGHPLDLCRSATCNAGFRDYVREQGHPEWASAEARTDEVLRDLAADDRSSLGAWLARRRFHRTVVSALVAHLAQQCPEKSAALLGVSPATAFGGVDVRALLQPQTGLGFVELYPVLDGRAHHAWTSGAPRPRSLATVFVQDGTPDGAAWQAWEHWLRGGDGLVIWSDGLLEDHPEHRARLARAVADIRRVNARVGDAAPALSSARIAVLSDPDSVAASWLCDALHDGSGWLNRFPSHQRKFGTYERKLATWLRLIEDHGEIPGAVSFESDLSGIDVLVLPSVRVLGESDLRRMERFLTETNGVIIIDGELGWSDRAGRVWDQDVHARLSAIAPKRVLAAPRGLDVYLARRLTHRGERLHNYLADALSTARADRPVLTVRCKGDPMPLLVSQRRTKGTVVFAVLPNLGEPEERAQVLRTVDLEIRFRGQPLEVEWLQPRDGRTAIEPGSAAVFAVEHP